MKNLVGGIALSFILVGCGGAEMDENANTPEPTVAQTEQGICEGWQNGANRCTALCGGAWRTVGYYPAIGYGDCGAAANSYCNYYYGTNASGACWSY